MDFNQLITVRTLTEHLVLAMFTLCHDWKQITLLLDKEEYAWQDRRARTAYGLY